MRKIVLNISILFFAYLIPFYLLFLYKDSSILVGRIQIPLHILMFIGSILLVYLNYKNKKQEPSSKWYWIFFQTIGIIGSCYSLFILYLLFAFDAICCGL